MQKRLTITIDQQVYEDLHRVVGRENISPFIENLLRCHMLDADIENGYKEMARDEAREAEAHQWSEGLLGDAHDAIR
jgi:predicted CopG family antitoxin